MRGIDPVQKDVTDDPHYVGSFANAVREYATRKAWTAHESEFGTFVILNPDNVFHARGEFVGTGRTYEIVAGTVLHYSRAVLFEGPYSKLEIFATCESSEYGRIEVSIGEWCRWFREDDAGRQYVFPIRAIGPDAEYLIER
jgi:hypothetical protein